MDFNNIIGALQATQIDIGLSGFTYNPERECWFSTPYLNSKQVIITRNDTNQATTPPQLRYMKVVTTTTADGIDKNEVIKNDAGSFELPSTITVLANNEQAKLLAEYEGTTNIHVALVYRGDKDTANKFLNIQNDYFKTSGGATNE